MNFFPNNALKKPTIPLSHNHLRTTKIFFLFPRISKEKSQFSRLNRFLLSLYVCNTGTIFYDFSQKRDEEDGDYYNLQARLEIHFLFLSPQKESSHLRKRTSIIQDGYYIIYNKQHAHVHKPQNIRIFCTGDKSLIFNNLQQAKIQGTYFKLQAIYFKIHGLYFLKQAMCVFCTTDRRVIL